VKGATAAVREARTGESRRRRRAGTACIPFRRNFRFSRLSVRVSRGLPPARPAAAGPRASPRPV
jgi:hypothetical protein